MSFYNPFQKLPITGGEPPRGRQLVNFNETEETNRGEQPATYSYQHSTHRKRSLSQLRPIARNRSLKLQCGTPTLTRPINLHILFLPVGLLQVPNLLPVGVQVHDTVPLLDYVLQHQLAQPLRNNLDVPRDRVRAREHQRAEEPQSGTGRRGSQSRGGFRSQTRGGRCRGRGQRRGRGGG